MLIVTATAISIHALREEGDGLRYVQDTGSAVFLSTPSARRATGHLPKPGRQLGISIHALREEGDRSGWRLLTRPSDFYPRPPRGGRRKRSKSMRT